MRALLLWIGPFVLALGGCSEVLGFDAYLAASSGTGGATGGTTSGSGTAGSGGTGTTSGSAATSGSGATSGTGAASGGTSTTSGSSGSAGSGGGMNGCPMGEVCVPVAPSGWEYVVFHQSAFQAGAAPPCPRGNDPITFFEDPAPSECNNCKCDWVGATCSEPQLSCYYGNGSCAGLGGLVLAPSDSACLGPASIPLNQSQVASCEITSPPKLTSPGACQASTPVQKFPKPWLGEIHLCSEPVDPNAMCGGGQCVGAGAGLYAVSPCIQKPGDVACPAAFAVKNVVYASATDNRDCGGCSCDSPVVKCEMGTYNAFDDSACAGFAVSITAGSCVDIGNRFSDGTRSLKPPLIDLQLDINCIGGAPTGSVTPVDPRTICCQ